MRKVLKSIIFALSLTLSWQIAVAGESEVLGFQAWKAGRIEESKAQFERLQLELAPEKPAQSERNQVKAAVVPLAAPPIVPAGVQGVGQGAVRANDSVPKQARVARSEQRLQQAQLNLEIAREHNVSDYLVLYLSQFQNKEAFLEAAKKLSVEETAEMMMSYQRTMLTAGQVEASASASVGTGSTSNSLGLTLKPRPSNL